MKPLDKPKCGGREVSDVDVEAFCRMRRLSRMLAELDIHCKRQRQPSWLTQGAKVEDMAQLLSALQTELRVCHLLRGQGNGRGTEYSSGGDWQVARGPVRAKEEDNYMKTLRTLLSLSSQTSCGLGLMMEACSRLSRRTWRSLDACVRTAERKLEKQEGTGMLDPWLLSHKPQFPRLRRLRYWLRHLLPPWRQRDVISYVVEVAPMVDVSVSKVMDALDPDLPSSSARYSLDVRAVELQALAAGLRQTENASSYKPERPP